MRTRTGCCLYSVRSYVKAGEAGAGETNWTADYWRGATSGIDSSLSVAVDADQHVYVAGSLATSASGGTWNLIKYHRDTGNEIWKVDIASADLIAIAYHQTNGTIHVRGGGFVRTIDAADGAILSGTADASVGTVKGLLWDDTIAGVRQQPIQSPVVGQNPNQFPMINAIAGGRVVVLGGLSSGHLGNQLFMWDDYAPPGPGGAFDGDYQFWSIEGSGTASAVAFHSVDMIVGGGANLLAVGARIVFSEGPDVVGMLALLDTSIDTGGVVTGGVFSGSAYPITSRWRDLSITRPRTQLKFQDATYLIVGCNSLPTIEAVQTSDGARVWGHYHLQPTGIAIGTDTIATVGVRKHKNTDVDFV